MRTVKIPNVEGLLDTFPCYSYVEFPYGELSKAVMRTNHKRHGTSYLTTFATFDIESTTIPETKKAFMYHWQCCIGGILAYGRTWKEWEGLLKKLSEALSLSQERTLVIYVHNLGFEFQFMKEFMQRSFGACEIFAAQPRKPIHVRYAGLEFRCSWKLSNMSLDKYTQFERGVRHIKQSGDLDYRKIRTPGTWLEETEFAYCMGDVLSLYEAVSCALKNDRDNLESIPMTSTGYVRRECRKAAARQDGYREMFLGCEMTERIYGLLKQAARGGDTHANRRLAGKTLEACTSYDVQSSYPYVMATKRFPMTRFVPYGTVDGNDELEGLLREKACLFTLTLVGVRLDDAVSMPYIPADKCRHLKGALKDNGRVISADGLSITVTELDFSIVRKQYGWDEMYVSDMHVAELGYLPESIRGVVLSYFSQKTELKARRSHAAGQEKADMEYWYAKSKNRINSIFGMCYTDPVRDIVEMLDDGSWRERRPDDIADALMKYQKSRNSFLVYAWGVWVTAHARGHLDRLREAAGQELVAYQDTDSVKGSLDVSGIERENAAIRKECEDMGAYCDCEGRRYYLGVYEADDGTPYRRFRTLGAKKYAYEDDQGELHLTVSGVNKELGAKELGSLDRFRPGFVFREAGGRELTYNQEYIHEIEMDGCLIETASNIAITDSTYELGVTEEYSLLTGIPYI